MELSSVQTTFNISSAPIAYRFLVSINKSLAIVVALSHRLFSPRFLQLVLHALIVLTVFLSTESCAGQKKFAIFVLTSSNSFCFLFLSNPYQIITK